MTRRFQFSLRALLILVFGAACFLGGIRFERERRRRADEAMAPQFPAPVVIDSDYWPQATEKHHGSPFDQ